MADLDISLAEMFLKFKFKSFNPLLLLTTNLCFNCKCSEISLRAKFYLEEVICVFYFMYLKDLLFIFQDEASYFSCNFNSKIRYCVLICDLNCIDEFTRLTSDYIHDDNYDVININKKLNLID